MSDELELTTGQPDAMELQNMDAPDGLSLMKMVISKGGPEAVSMLERLMPIRRELQAEQAKREFDAAMAEFQRECPVVVKRKPGAEGKYKFAPIEDILEQPTVAGEKIKDLISRHGFSHATDTEVEAGWVKAICTVTHRAGHSKTTSFKVPIDERAKLMTAPQQYAGSFSFAKRYAFSSAFGIVTAGEDMEDRLGKTNPQGKDPAARALATTLWNLFPVSIRGKAGNWDAVNQWLWEKEILDGANPADTAPHLPAKRMQQVIQAVKTHPEIAK